MGKGRKEEKGTYEIQMRMTNPTYVIVSKSQKGVESHTVGTAAEIVSLTFKVKDVF